MALSSSQYVIRVTICHVDVMAVENRDGDFRWGIRLLEVPLYGNEQTVSQTFILQCLVSCQIRAHQIKNLVTSCYFAPSRPSAPPTTRSLPWKGTQLPLHLSGFEAWSNVTKHSMVMMYGDFKDLTVNFRRLYVSVSGVLPNSVLQ
jgi:hypothetical protein